MQLLFTQVAPPRIVYGLYIMDCMKTTKMSKLRSACYYLGRKKLEEVDRREERKRGTTYHR